jgi:NADH-quinone oxidoreductase subunit J
MSTTAILFWFLSALALVSATMVLISKSPVHSILWLIMVFFAISGHYILLNAQFIAIVNLIVYAGAIMVLFLFVVMLMNLNSESEPKKNSRLRLAGTIAGTIAGGCLMIIMIVVLRGSVEMQQTTAMANQGNIGLIKTLGKVLFTDYVVPFEITSVLFLSAMVGAVVIGKKETPSP